MLVVKYLKENGLQALVDNFSIKVKEYEEGLTVYNYCQIASHKTPMTSECRGLILDKNFNIVSRSFDRFFNIHEQPETQKHIDMSKAELFEKVDGSLIKIYCWNNTWYVSTRGTAFAESEVNGFPITFKELVFKALNIEQELSFQIACTKYLHPDYTWVFEVTSMENRVVTRYEGYMLHFLSARSNQTGIYVLQDIATKAAERFGATIPKSFTFDSVEACIETAKNLPNLAEGYVLYQDGVPVCKIKSPVYCAIHLIKGEGLNPKRIAELVLTGEQAEYLAYYPEDTVHIEPYVASLDRLIGCLHVSWHQHKHIQGQKEFAMAVKELPYSSVMFKAKKPDIFTCNVHITDVFYSMPDSYKLKLLLEEHAFWNTIP